MDWSESAFAALAEQIASASQAAFGQLLRDHPETYYYFTLTTSGDAIVPCATAWSEEALERTCAAEAQPELASRLLRWSYADSPYCCYGQDHFAAVLAAFEERGFLHEMSDQDSDREFLFRLDAMEVAMRRLDQLGFFGTDEARANCTIHVEVMPPDHTNSDRAKRLNPFGAALSTWLMEMSEEPA